MNDLIYNANGGNVLVKRGEMKKIYTQFAMVCSCGHFALEGGVLKSNAKNALTQTGWRYLNGGWKCPRCVKGIQNV